LHKLQQLNGETEMKNTQKDKPEPAPRQSVYADPCCSSLHYRDRVLSQPKLGFTALRNFVGCDGEGR